MQQGLAMKTSTSDFYSGENQLFEVYFSPKQLLFQIFCAFNAINIFLPDAVR